MQIRKLLKQDYENWLSLWKGYQDFYNVSLTSELSKLTFDRLIDESEEMGCFMLEVGQSKT